MKQFGLILVLIFGSYVDVVTADASVNVFGIHKAVTNSIFPGKKKSHKITFSSSSSSSSLLQLRGGASIGGFDAASITKPAIVLVGAQGVTGCVSPKTGSELYGWNSNDPLLRYIFYFLNGALLCISVTLGLQVLYNVPRMEAIGYASIAYSIVLINVLLNQVYETVRSLLASSLPFFFTSSV